MRRFDSGRATVCALAMMALAQPSSLGASARVSIDFVQGQSQGKSSAPPSPRMDERHLIDVPASAAWTDSGVTVKPGDRVDIRAWGRIRYADVNEGVESGPVGAGSSGRCEFVVLDARVPARALVGNVAAELTFDGLGFLVGSAWSGTAPVRGASAPEGRLFLGINHDAVTCDRSGFDSWRFRNNGRGSFTVQVTVRRATTK